MIPDLIHIYLIPDLISDIMHFDLIPDLVHIDLIPDLIFDIMHIDLIPDLGLLGVN